MSNIAIDCQGISKQYRIGEQETYRVLRDVLVNVAKSPLRRLRGALKSSSNHVNGNGTSPEGSAPHCSFIWALNDVSFQVPHGEVVGIIGPNGAGKSTLLKILSRITRPTRGHAVINGRVGSLLEVGTGFHPELSGRENIYLNGAILGMRKAEIDRKFDEIVAFAEVEKFIDTPVKRYSSGMYVRLAFAVAAHMETEVLVVDEVLAVGDADFQKKCLGKMGDVARHGRTVLFVSHNMQSVARLCQRALLLHQGTITASGNTAEVMAQYLSCGLGLTTERVWDDLRSAPGSDVVRLESVRIKNNAGETQGVFDSRHPVAIEIGYSVLQEVNDLAAEFVIYDDSGNLLFTSANQYDDDVFTLHRVGCYVTECWIPGNLMTEGTFMIRISIVQIQVPVQTHVFEENILVFQVVDNMDGDSARGRIAHNYPGLIRPKLEWATTFTPERDRAAS
jgi:lipopolysaccharide transport system ATP-binding protein